jgi:hypothetical protein
MERMEVDRVVASISEEKFGKGGVEVIMVEGSNGLYLAIKDEVLEYVLRSRLGAR